MKTITYLKGDATKPEVSGHKIIAHCCNNLGAWGAGFVLSISRRWPQPERSYRAEAVERHGQLTLGSVQFVRVEPDIEVANIVGQEGTSYFNGKAPIRYFALSKGLQQVGTHALEIGASIHLPRLGCGLAGGNWTIVEELILPLCEKGMDVFVYDL